MVYPSRSTSFFFLPRRPASLPLKAGRRGRKKNLGDKGHGLLRLSPSARSGGLLAAPLLLELHRRQIPQRRVNPLVVVDRVQETPQLPQSVRVVVVLRQIHL